MDNSYLHQVSNIVVFVLIIFSTAILGYFNLKTWKFVVEGYGSKFPQRAVLKKWALVSPKSTTRLDRFWLILNAIVLLLILIIMILVAAITVGSNIYVK